MPRRRHHLVPRHETGVDEAADQALADLPGAEHGDALESLLFQCAAPTRRAPSLAPSLPPHRRGAAWRGPHGSMMMVLRPLGSEPPAQEDLGRDRPVAVHGIEAV